MHKALFVTPNKITHAMAGGGGSADDGSLEESIITAQSKTEPLATFAISPRSQVWKSD
jgi:hypothetical protein